MYKPIYPYPFPVMSLIVPSMFFYKDDFSIKYPMKVDMPSAKKTNETYQGEAHNYN